VSLGRQALVLLLSPAHLHPSLYSHQRFKPALQSSPKEAVTIGAFRTQHTTTDDHDHTTHQTSYDKQRHLNVKRDVYCHLSAEFGADEDNGSRLGQSFTTCTLDNISLT